MFTILTPFVTKHPEWLFIHLMTLTSIILHWVMNNDACVLTEIEYILEKQFDPDTTRSNTFFGSIMNPIYTIRNDMIYKFTVMLWLISFNLTTRNLHSISI